MTRGSVALAGYALSGCATGGPSRGAPRARRALPAVNLLPSRASFDRVIRDDGRAAAAPRLGASCCAPEKLRREPIHNYGHAGAGMSLAWGCGVMAAEFAQETGQRRAAVVGCGSPGLTAARQLQRRGFDVTIYAATVPPDTTSNMSLAGFTPTTALVSNERRTPAWDAQFLRAAEISYRQLQLMVGPEVRRLLDGQLQRHRQRRATGSRRRAAAATTTARPTPISCRRSCGPTATAKCSAPANIRSPHRPTRCGRRPSRSSRTATWTRW